MFFSQTATHQMYVNFPRVYLTVGYGHPSQLQWTLYLLFPGACFILLNIMVLSQLWKGVNQISESQLYDTIYLHTAVFELIV